MPDVGQSLLLTSVFSMQEIRRKRAIAVGLRARMPLVTRALALFVIVAGIIFVGISYYRLRHTEPFRLRSETPELSKQVTSVVEGYERRRKGSLWRKR